MAFGIAPPLASLTNFCVPGTPAKLEASALSGGSYRYSTWCTSPSHPLSTSTNSISTLSGDMHMTLSGVSDRLLALTSISTADTSNANAVDYSSWALVDPALTAAAIILIIIGLLWAWETLVHALHKSTPPSLQPVVDVSLAEIGGLGFIGLLLELCHKYLGTFVHDHKEVLESFEFLHTAFFQVAMMFFIAAGFMVRETIQKIDQFRHSEDDILATIAGSSSSSEEGQPLELENGTSGSVQDQDNQNYHELLHQEQLTEPTTLWNELTQPSHTGTDFLAVRHRFLQRYQLPREYRLDLTAIFASYLNKLIHFQPTIWLPLLPILSIGQALDLKHHVVSAASGNSLATAGFFYSTSIVWFVTLLWQGGTLVLFLFNATRMVEWQNRAREAIRGRTATSNGAILSENGGSEGAPLLGEAANASNQAEVGIQPSQDETEQESQALAIPEWYLVSLQYHAWLSLSFVMLIVSDILSRDYQALLTGATVGDPSGLVPETIWYTVFAILSVIQLAYVPRFFWSFCLINFDRDRVTQAAIQKQLRLVALEGAANANEPAHLTELLLAKDTEIATLRAKINDMETRKNS